MKKHLLTIMLSSLLLLTFVPLLVMSKETKDVVVTNFPPVQTVDGTVSVGNTTANPVAVDVTNETLGVNVSNTPDVNVVNDKLAPVLTRSVDAPGRNIFVKGDAVFLPAGTTKRSEVIVSNQDIPIGAVLVIDFVSLNLRTDFEQNIVTTLLHKIPGILIPRIVSRSVTTPLLQSEADSWNASEKFMAQIFLEHDPSLGPTAVIFSIGSDRRETIGRAFMNYYVSGHFVESLP